MAAFAGDLFFMIRFYVKVLKARQSGNAYAHSVDDVITLAEADERASVNIYKIMTPFPL